jgi:ribokinase
MSRIFVLGNASIDTTLRVPRLPHPGETLMAAGIRRAPGGKGLNQAVAAARAGAEVHFCAALGAEPEAEIVRAALAAEPLIGIHLIDVGQPSDLSSLMVAPNGENCIVSTGACCDALPLEAARAFLAPLRPDDILLVQGNLTEQVTAWAVARSDRAMVNTAPIRWDLRPVLSRAWLAIANRVEAQEIAGTDDPAGLGAATGIVTLGAEGCRVAGPEGRFDRPAPKVTAVDTTGAGDVFCGVLAAGLVQGLPLRHAIDAAQQAAALSVARPGCFAAIPAVRELRLPARAPPG